MKYTESTCYVDELSDDEWVQIWDVTCSAFVEHKVNGLNMTPCDITLEQLKKFLQGCRIFFVRDDERIVAYCAGRLRNNGVNNFLEAHLTSVHTEYKGKGLGKRLFLALENFAKNSGCLYLITDTSCKARSSQAYHISCGFKRWYYTHFHNKNYRSIVFRKDLKKIYPENKRILTLLRSWIATHLKYRHDGSSTLLYRAWRRLMDYFNRSPKNASLLTLGEIQEVSYRLLVWFDELCRQHNLRYLLCYGSLLGAIRHRGMIPWDDDIDVSMPLPDYEKFISIFNKIKQNSEIDLLYGMKGNVGTPFAMLVEKRTFSITPGRDRRHSHPIGIDIFPAYALSDDEKEARRQIQDIRNFVINTHSCLKAPSLMKFKSRLCHALFSKRKLRNTLDRIRSLIYENSWGSTKQIRILSLEENQFLALPSDVFDNYLMQDFGNRKFRIPACYHEHLSELYGDYMKLPPKEFQHGILTKVYRLH